MNSRRPSPRRQRLLPSRAPSISTRSPPPGKSGSFLVLSIFIGIISGLLVVAFRMAIEWIQILTLGSAPHPGQFGSCSCPAWRVCWWPSSYSGSFLRHAAAASTRPRQRSTSTTAYLGQDDGRQIHYRRDRHRRRPLAWPRRPVIADRRGRRLGRQPPGFACRANGCGCLPRSVRRPAWPPPSMLPSRPSCL